MHDATIIGSGIIGITSAIRLTEAGLSTRVITKALPTPPQGGYSPVCSNAAGAIWWVYKAYPEDRVNAWAFATLHELTAAYGQGVGVSPLPVTLVSHRPITPPAWFDHVGYTPVDDAHFPHALQITVPLVEPQPYLDHLIDRYQTLGGVVEVATVKALDDLAHDSRVVVNCAGMGARDLTGDPHLKPIRGQITVLAQPDTPLTDGLMFEDDHDRPLYIFPAKTTSSSVVQRTPTNPPMYGTI